MLNVPVVLLIFNRPTHTRRVFAEIARARPTRLLVVADGPRNPEEARLCAETRSIVAEVDWECEVSTNFSEVNLGCRLRPATGITWAFECCEEAIILEDDCVPHPSFFPYCRELLERYRDDQRVMTIGGNNFQFGRTRTPYSYYFSRYPHIWGWASWRRAWQHYDIDIRLWQELRSTGWLLDLLGDEAARNYWNNLFDEICQISNFSTWDYQWIFANWVNNSLAISPNVNLVSNIGFGTDSTHTRDHSSILGRIPTAEMAFPLSHPPCMVRHRDADQFVFDRTIGYKYSDLYGRLLRRLRLTLPRACPWPSHDLYDL